jgi:hypothetical protein
VDISSLPAPLLLYRFVRPSSHLISLHPTRPATLLHLMVSSFFVFPPPYSLFSGPLVLIRASSHLHPSCNPLALCYDPRLFSLSARVLPLLLHQSLLTSRSFLYFESTLGRFVQCRHVFLLFTPSHLPGVHLTVLSRFLFSPIIM